MEKVISASRIFTGEEWLDDHAVIIKEGIITKLLPIHEIPPGMEQRHYADAMLCAPFIDAQVYGAGGRLFSLYADTSTLKLMNEVFTESGTLLFQPTLATNSITVFKNCIDALRKYWDEGGRGVHGLHLEGPWINAGKKGAHLQEFIHVPTVEEVKDLLDYGRGVITMITLAPEVCSTEILDLIAEEGIIISAGHSEADHQQARDAFNHRITTVTHLFNAMTPLHHRAPGIPGAVFNHESVMASIIPDGFHVDHELVKIAAKQMGDRLFVITDAVTETSEGPYRHQRAGDKYECNGTLSGSALSMHQAFLNLVHGAGMDLGEALNRCSLYPARALEIEYLYGKIAPQYVGQFIVLDKQLKLVDVLAN